VVISALDRIVPKREWHRAGNPVPNSTEAAS
jgi:hypothetical protein